MANFRRVTVGRLPFWRRQAIGSWVDAGVWPAKWIALPGEPEAARTVAYRNCFTLAAPEKFMLGVCADAVYRLWLDGEELATGPELGDVEHTYVDTYELALEAGPHALVAAVSSFGGRGPYAKIEFRHGFLAAVDGACAAQLETNARNWQACPVPGHRFAQIPGWPGSVGQELIFDAAGYPDCTVCASNSLDEYIVRDLILQGARVDSFGIGENMITAKSDPVFGGVYKLVAVKRPDGSYQPKMKCSDSASKAIIPGKKMPWRLYDENGQAQCDLIAMDSEVIEAGKPVTMVNLDSDAIERTVTIVPTRVKQLLVPHILNGELAIELPSIAEKKAYIAKQLTEETWESELRIEMPHKHYVNMTPAVAECRSKMYAELHGGKV